jgi:hypothetical protein
MIAHMSSENEKDQVEAVAGLRPDRRKPAAAHRHASASPLITCEIVARADGQADADRVRRVLAALLVRHLMRVTSASPFRGGSLPLGRAGSGDSSPSSAGDLGQAEQGGK